MSEQIEAIREQLDAFQAKIAYYERLPYLTKYQLVELHRLRRLSQAYQEKLRPQNADIDPYEFI